MSWSRLVVLCLCVLLAGCGYRPLYGKHGPENASVVDELTLVRIESIPDRIGRQIYNMLRERLNPYSQPERPRYVLRVELTESRGRLFLEEDETATRADVTLKANFVLTRLEDSAIVARGSSRSVSSYDILSSQFASVVSQEDARLRTAGAI